MSDWRGDLIADWEHDLLDTVTVRRSTLQALLDDSCGCAAAREGRPHEMSNVCPWCDIVKAMQATPKPLRGIPVRVELPGEESGQAR